MFQALADSGFNEYWLFVQVYRQRINEREITGFSSESNADVGIGVLKFNRVEILPFLILAEC